MLRTFSAMLVSALMLWVGGRYCWLTITGATDPVFATWLVLMVSVSLAFWTYCRTEGHNLIDNIGNTVDLVVVLMIVFCVSVFGKNIRSGFTWFEIGNLVLAGVIVCFWWWNGDPFYSNLAVNGLMVIGYLPTIARVAVADQNPEPWSVWIPVWLASVLSMAPAYFPEKKIRGESSDWKETVLPKVYATRATVLVTTLILLMLRLEL